MLVWVLLQSNRHAKDLCHWFKATSLASTVDWVPTVADAHRRRQTLSWQWDFPASDKPCVSLSVLMEETEPKGSVRSGQLLSRVVSTHTPRKGLKPPKTRLV